MSWPQGKLLEVKERSNYHTVNCRRPTSGSLETPSGHFRCSVYALKPFLVLQRLPVSHPVLRRHTRATSDTQEPPPAHFRRTEGTPRTLLVIPHASRPLSALPDTPGPLPSLRRHPYPLPSFIIHPRTDALETPPSFFRSSGGPTRQLPAFQRHPLTVSRAPMVPPGPFLVLQRCPRAVFSAPQVPRAISNALEMPLGCFRRS